MKYYKFILGLVVAFIFNSCKENVENIQPILDVSTSSLSFLPEGGVGEFSVNTNQEDWTVSLADEVDWCTLETIDKTVKVTVGKNENIDLRSTTIIVNAGELSKDIKLEQSGSEPILSIAKNEIKFGADEGIEMVDIITNIAELEVTCGDDWCTPSVEDGKLVVKVKENTDPVERMTNVILSGADKQVVLEVCQEAATEKVKLLKINLPIDFSSNNILNVMDGETKVAEICHEYIASEGIPMDVIYPMKDGKTDLTSGMVLGNGGTLVWNLEDNTCEYSAGNLSPDKVWIKDDGSISFSEESNGIDATLAPYYIIDVRGASSEVYKTVKIGTQYWMAENLRTEYYLDGTAIAQDWNSTNGAYIYLYDNPKDYKALYGALYNGYAVTNESQLAPEGWKVPENEDWSIMLGYIGKNNSASLLKSELFDDKGIFTNLTGFNAYPALSYNTATNFLDQTLETWFWSNSSVYDILSKENSMYYLRMQKDKANVVFNDDSMIGSFHSPAFGHSVRCVRE